MTIQHDIGGCVHVGLPLNHKCATPTSTATPTPTATPTGTPTATPTPTDTAVVVLPTPTNAATLPVTGPDIGAVTATGFGMIAVGALALIAMRRNARAHTYVARHAA